MQTMGNSYPKASFDKRAEFSMRQDCFCLLPSFRQRSSSSALLMLLILLIALLG